MPVRLVWQSPAGMGYGKKIMIGAKKQENAEAIAGFNALSSRKPNLFRI